jgi:hypothetical protein
MIEFVVTFRTAAVKIPRDQSRRSAVHRCVVETKTIRPIGAIQPAHVTVAAFVRRDLRILELAVDGHLTASFQKGDERARRDGERRGKRRGLYLASAAGAP